MSDWQVSTLRALGLPARGLAGGTPPGASDPLTSPVAPPAPRAAAPRPSPLTPPPFAAPAPPAEPSPYGGSPYDPLTAPAAPPVPAVQSDPLPYGGAPPPSASAAPLSPVAPAVQSEPLPYAGTPPPGIPAAPPSPAAPVVQSEPSPYGGTPPPAVPAPPPPLPVRPPTGPVPTAEPPAGQGEPSPGGIPQPVVPAPHDSLSALPPVPEIPTGQGEPTPPGMPVEEDVWTQGAHPPGGPVADELMRRMRHGDPLSRRVGRGVRRAVGARAAQTVREQEAAAGILGQVVSSCRRIAVTSLRGGAGKTTVTALVARTIAEHRGDRTLVLDADPSLGSLPLRLGVDAERSYRGLTTLPNWEAAQSYLTQAGERLWVASASASRALTNELTLPEFQTAQGEFSRYFGISLVDCGPGLTSDLHQGVLASSHAQILIAPATADGALSTRSALDWFLRSPHAHLLQRTLVVMVTHTPHVDGDLNRSRALLAAEGVPVIHLPYDRHLAAGTAVDPALIAETSQATAVHMATAAFTRATA
ncbi:hypothetical protein [Actinocorallia libanotica]|uniref:CobQ/CobB/MinD/ParA nucleotide binding domain-containing protein n=1 Tax=Actinocorallia libanotica TaxID=46162 RepID=A0ABN1RX33_9ACTN